MAGDHFAISIRIEDLRIAAHAPEGGEALLGCQFDMEGEKLYSVKWYKDGREFYRYTPENEPNIMHFPASGVNVDINRSSSNVVTIVHLTRESAGVYRCEVCSDAPYFSITYREKQISIYLLPKGGPKITGLQEQYAIGDELSLNCTSPPSRPEAELKWLLNEKPAPVEYILGPWYKITTSYPDPPVQTKLKLHFRIMPEHYVNGVMTVNCQATIAPLYHRESNSTYYLNTSSSDPSIVEPLLDPEQITTEDNVLESPLASNNVNSSNTFCNSNIQYLNTRIFE
ncbi:uncharacterized protein ACR2FA_001791 [Aphomia sociella]